MAINLLVVFDAIMTEGNISRAADKSGTTQSAMSNAQSRMRASLDDKLFERTVKGLESTPRALQIEESIHISLNLIADSLGNTQIIDYVKSRRKFTPVLNDYGEVLILPKLMQQLEELRSGVEIEVISSSRKSAKEDFFIG